MLSELVFASHNPGKIEEVAEALASLPIRLRHAGEFDLEAPEENGATYLENALLKARFVMKATGLPALADDSGLEIEALDGRPGVHTAPFAQALGGYEATFAYLAQHPDIQGNPRARFHCTLVLMMPDESYTVYEGTVPGQLCFPAKGERRFGYDPIFQADGTKDVYAMLTHAEKRPVSHRGRALEAIAQDLRSRFPAP